MWQVLSAELPPVSFFFFFSVCSSRCCCSRDSAGHQVGVSGIFLCSSQFCNIFICVCVCVLEYYKCQSLSTKSDDIGGTTSFVCKVSSFLSSFLYSFFLWDQSGTHFISSWFYRDKETKRCVCVCGVWCVCVCLYRSAFITKILGSHSEMVVVITLLCTYSRNCNH